ncbi:hypothetical protein ACQKJZ_08790 [Sphingomonas sp. NPDC019816]|uniref:hypothetical protein n=1 Tax=Sphingomonas sp. NPDC019816 TaxID=3390679 RepID=UPI003D04961F
MANKQLDPEEWARDLMHDLDVLGGKYLEARQSRDCVSRLGEPPQTLIAAIVQRVTGALRAIPAFEDNLGVAALHDLQGALLDLHIGKRPPLLQPLPNAGSAKDTLSRQLVKQYGLLAVKVLVSCGSPQLEARSLVANALSATGHVGRKGGRITEKTIWEWDVKADHKAKAFLARHHDEVVSSVGGDLERAKKWADMRLRQPGMATKIWLSPILTGCHHVQFRSRPLAFASMMEAANATCASPNQKLLRRIRCWKNKGLRADRVRSAGVSQDRPEAVDYRCQRASCPAWRGCVISHGNWKGALAPY